MKRKNFLLCLALLGLAISPASAQILTNGSFESDLTGWGSFGTTSVITPGTPYSNQDAAKVAQLPASSFSGLLQFPTLTPNTDYTFSALVAGDVVGDDSVIRFLLADSTFGVTLDQRQFQISATALGNAMTSISYSFNSSTVSAAGLQIDSFGIGGTPRVIYLDNVVITANPVAAPEPGALMLLALGGAVVVIRRKRNLL